MKIKGEEGLILNTGISKKQVSLRPFNLKNGSDGYLKEKQWKSPN